jgi:hypothetical protein
LRGLVGTSQGNAFAGESEHDVNVTRGDRTDIAQKAINDAIKRRKDLTDAAAEASLKEADIEKDTLSSHEQMAALRKVEFDLEQKRAKLVANPLKVGDDITARLKEWIALGIQADTATAKLERKFDLGQATSAAKFQTGSFDVDLARRQITEGSENATADALETEIKKAQIMVGLADDRLRIEGKTQSAIDEQTSAINAEQIAIAKRDKNRIDTKFKDDQELTKAKTDNAVTALKDRGFSFEANILKIREQTEAKIAQHLKDQKGELAQQDKIAGQLSLKEAAKAALRNPAGAQAEQRAAAREEANFQRQLQYYQEQKSRGVKFDDSDPIAKIIKNYLTAKEQLDKTVTGKEGAKDDFSSVSSLAGKDFSSLASLGDANFDGLKALANLQLTIQ